MVCQTCLTSKTPRGDGDGVNYAMVKEVIGSGRGGAVILAISNPTKYRLTPENKQENNNIIVDDKNEF